MNHSLIIKGALSFFLIVILGASTVFAQSGPGGVSSNLALWFAANSGSEISSGVPAADGNDIEFWRDQSANGYDAEQSIAGVRPTYRESTSINGNPTMEFEDGDYLPIQTLSYDVTPGNQLTELTVYSVMQTNQTDEGILLSYDRSSFFRFAVDHNNDGNYGLSTSNDGVEDDFNGNTSEANGIPHLIGATYSVAADVKNLLFDGRIDAVNNPVYNPPANAFLGSAPELPRVGIIGAGSEAAAFPATPGPANHFVGDLGEIIYFERVLNETERQQVESYLAIKYGITLSTDTDGDNVALETGTINEGDYRAADGVTVVWDADVQTGYQFNMGGIALDDDLDQPSSASVNASNAILITDNSLAENDYILWGDNNAGFSASPSASSFALQLDREWRMQITGSTNNVDEIEFDLSGVSVLPSDPSDIAMLVANNPGFTGASTISGTLSGTTFTVSNADLSAFAPGDLYFTIAFTLPTPAGLTATVGFWYKGDMGVQDGSANPAGDGSSVRYWRDQSGNGYDGQQDDTAEQPSFEATDLINFNPSLSFNGSTHLPIRDLNYEIGVNPLDALTIYSVVKSSQTDEGIVVSYDRSSYFRFALNHNNAGDFGLSTTVDDAFDDTNASSFDANDGQAQLIGGSYAIASDETNLYFNGGVETFPAAHSPVLSELGNTGEQPTFGYVAANSEARTFNGSDGGAGIDGSVAEIIYFEEELTPGDRARVESYLAIKYGITLTSDYVASTGSTVWDNAANVGYNNAIAVIATDGDYSLSQTQSKSEVSGSILTIENSTLSDGDYLAAGSDNGTLDLTTSGTGSQDARLTRSWKYQLTNATSADIDFDLSSLIIKPQVAASYVLLVSSDGTFSSPTEVTATSFDGTTVSFDGVSLTGNEFLALSFDPDLDNDGIADADDLDDDNDGIPDTDEGNGATDTDGDGIADSRDLDSDNDGIGDLYESGAEGSGTALATLDANGDGIIDAANVGANGLDDRLETAADNGVLAYTISDSDGLGPVDFRDLDTDNNGISDLVESGRSTSIDSDDDGIFEGTDTDQDGVPDEIDEEDSTFGSTQLIPSDQDGTGEPDFRDLDNDDDGIEDVDEVGLIDTTPDDGRLDDTTDADGDGVSASRDDDEAVFGQINIADLLSGSGQEWYSYRSGDWSEPDNWTLDPSGSVRVNPSSQIPNNFVDNVFILNGDNMILDFDGLVVSSIDIEAGGSIDVGTTINHNFNTISGEGTIEIASDVFPGGTRTDFISSNGGTVIYTDQNPVADYELTVDRTFNNVIINASGSTVTLKADLTVNGDLTVEDGTLQINDNISPGDTYTDNTTPLAITVQGDLLVESAGTISTGNVDASTEIGTSGVFNFHTLSLFGDLTNNGTISFTNLSPTSISDGRYRDKYPTASDEDNNTGSNDIPAAEFGAVEVLFINDFEDQLVSLNGLTDFYRIEVNKGTSQTFTAEFNASAANNFRLLGRIAMDQSDDSGDTPNIDNHRALGLEAGIMKLGDNIVINQIAKEDNNGFDPSTQGGNRNYMIDVDAQLWLSSNAIVTKANDWGIHPFGKLKVSDDAQLTFSGTGQRTILVDNQGVFEMTGGTVDLTQYRNKTGADGAPRGSFIMTGGTLNLGGGDTDGNHAVFSVPWADQNFILSAANPSDIPEINILIDGNNRGKDRTAMQIGVKEGNFDVGESTINITNTNNNDYKIVSTAPLYNLSYTGTGTGDLIISDVLDADDLAPSNPAAALPDDNSGTIPSPAQFAVPLIVNNDLIINDGRFDANSLDVTVGNRFTVESIGEYDPGSNTTIFSGTSPVQSIRLNGTNPLVGGGFNNVSFVGSGTTKEFEGTLATIVILGNMNIGSEATLNDAGKLIQVNGSLSNSGIHITDFSSPGSIEITGGAATHEIGGDGNGRFSILTINDAINAISFTADQQIDSVLNLQAGLLNIGTNRLNIVSTATDPIRDDVGGIANFDATRMIQTAGNASDGGLAIDISSDGTYLFPIGSAGKYTPVDADLTLVNGNQGLVGITPVNGVLSTVAQTADEILNYYWRVTPIDFGTSDLPLVNSYTFTYEAGDVSGGNADTDFVAGTVLNESPFTRAYEGNIGVQVDATTITFDGLAADDGAGGTRTPFEILNANYTAGEIARFQGAPLIYYTKGRDRATTQPLWTTANTWTRNDQPGFDASNPHASTNPDAPDTPGPGDIAVIGFFPFDDPVTAYQGYPHSARINGGNIEAALLIFTQMTDDLGNAPVASRPISDLGGSNDFQFRPTLTWNSTGSILIDEIQGEGTIRVRGGSTNNNQRDPSFAAVDLIDFARTDSSVLLYEAFNDYTINNIPGEVPSLLIASDGFGSNDRTMTIVNDFITNQDLIIQGNANLTLGDTGGDILIRGDLDLLPLSSNVGGGELTFQNTGNARTVEVIGNVFIGNASGAAATGASRVEVETGGAVEHSLLVAGDIIVNTTTGGGLIFGDDTQSFIDLTVNGDQNTSLSVVNGDVPQLHRLTVDKGTTQSSTFTLDSDVILSGANDQTEKSITLLNGTLVLNNAALDLEINSGGGDFTIPASAGLDLQAGTVRVTATGVGSGNGIRLDGKVALNGGGLVLDGGAAADNYIEYGTGGASEIEINSGNLIVGSQLRRNILSGDGVLDYTQTGGTALFGVNTAPVDGRGVFEIVNTGSPGTSSFNLSGASTVFAIVNAQAAPTEGTFIIGSDVAVNVTTDPYIDFGFNNTVAGVLAENDLNETYEINVSASIPNMRIDNANFNSPIVEMVIQPLTVSNDLEILNNGTLRANNFALFLNNGFTNDGTYEPGTNTTIFNGTAQQIQGSSVTDFNDLRVESTTSLTLNGNIQVAGDLEILDGLLDDGGNQVDLEGNLTIVTEHVSSGSGGINMVGSSAQDIFLTDLAAEIDRLTINNSEGVILREIGGTAVTLTIDNEMVFTDGLFQLGDNRLIFDSDAAATATTVFDANRMISVNGVKKSDGVEKEFIPGDAAPFEIPVGTPEKYTPVTLDVDGSTDPGSILVKPINSIHPSATDVDALNYYWVVTTNPTTVAGFSGSISFEYLEADANNAGQNEADWENNAARLLAPNWFKPSGNLVDIGTNTMTFTAADLSSFGGTTFDGEFTIGNDIPNQLAQYRSVANDLWNEPTNWQLDVDGDGFDDGNGVPQPGTLVIVDAGDVVTMSAATDNDQNIFSLQIDGTLDVANSDGHNFGDVNGSGTLRISESTLPGGNYDGFFTTGNGALDLAGATSYTISPDFTDVRGLTISGGGVKTLPAINLNIGVGGITVLDGAQLRNNVNNNDITVSGDVNVTNGSFLLGGSAASLAAENVTVTSGTLTSSGAPMDLSGDLNLDGGTFNAGNVTHTLAGDFNYNSAATFNRSTGRITFDGSTDQTITSNSSTINFHNLRSDKSAGNLIVGANTTVLVNNRLGLLNNNVINTEGTGVQLRLVGHAVYAASSNGYVSGPLFKDLEDDNGAFTFRIGKGSTYKPVTVTPESGSFTGPFTYEAEYYPSNPEGFSNPGTNDNIDNDAIEINSDALEQVLNINGSEYWRIDSGTPTSSSLETIVLDVSNIDITNEDINNQLLQVMVWNNGTGEWDHLGGNSSGTVTNGTVASTVSAGFTERIFTSGSESSEALPVELIAFEAVAKDNVVTLDWATASEINNDYFEVQRSRDGFAFEAIGRVQGNGTTNELIAYTFRDRGPYSGVSYYRLKQVDFDGAFEIHPTIRVNNEFVQRGIEVGTYPNPSLGSSFKLRVQTGDENSPISIKIVDMSGRTYYQKQLAGALIVDQEIQPQVTMNPGIYFMLVEQGANSKRHKIIIR